MPEFELQSTPEIQLTGQSIWPNTQVWNQYWEIKYAEWLTKEVDTQFFSKYKVATDCADVAYAARWIFARIHGLPAANHLNGKVLFTNQSLRSEWQNLPNAKNWFEDRKFLAALNYLLNMTYTHTLMRDSYPVKITPEEFLPGIHYLNLHESSGHTQLVHRVNLAKDALPFLILQSTVPRKVRDLNESLFWASAAPVLGKSGFHKILWPQVSGSQYSLTAAQKMPSYSLHQYAVDFIRSKDVSFGHEVLLRLQPELDLLLILKNGLNDLRNSLTIRGQVVEDGYLACGQKSCPENSQGFEDWSTPSRDTQIMSLLNQLRALYSIGSTPDIRKEIADYLNQEQKQSYLILDGISYTLQQISAAWDLVLFSSNPNDEPGLRWGLEPQFVSLKIKKSLKEGLENRKRKMSFAEDQKLQRNQHIVSGYCKHFEVASCQKLKDELITILEISGETKTVNEWLAKTFWLNADPKQSVANQWGALQKTSPFQNLEGLAEFQVSKEGIGAAKDSNGVLKIGPMSVQGLLGVELPAGFKWQSFDRKLSVGYATAHHQILRYDFLKKSSDIFPVLLEDVEKVFLPVSDELIIFSQMKIWRLSFKNKTFQITWEGNFKTIKPANQEFLFIVEDLSGWKYLDLRGQQPVITPMLDLGFNETAIRLLMFENDNNYVFSENSYSSDYLIVQKVSGIFSEFKAPGHILGWSQGVTRAIGLSSNISDGVFILTLDHAFKIIQSEKMGSFIQSINGGFFLFEFF